MKWSLKLLLFLNFYQQHLILAILRGTCSQCMANKAACLDENHFAPCFRDQMTNNRVECPANSICTSDAAICRSVQDGFTPACYEDNCRTCKSDAFSFGCISETSYGFCYDGDTEPNPTTIRACPIGFVCSLESNSVCESTANGGVASCKSSQQESSTTMAPTSSTQSTVSTATTQSTTPTIPTTSTQSTASTPTTQSTASTATTQSTTPTIPTTSTQSTASTATTQSTVSTATTQSTTPTIPTTSTQSTASTATTQSTTPTIPTTSTQSTTSTTSGTTSTQTPPLTPSAFCAQGKREGYFRAPGDTTCKAYIYCFLLSGQYIGQQYVCKDFYNAETRKCQAVRPSDC